MEEIICYTQLLPPGETQSLTFWDILLDDRWTDGGFLCPDSVYSDIGDKNQKLNAKQDYEFLLRAVNKYPVKAFGQQFSQGDTPENAWENFRTDCYIIGKYQEILRENDYFNSLITALIQTASQYSWYQEGISFLEKMISRGTDYYHIDDNTRPILLYRNKDVCYDVLNSFIDALAEALKKCHQCVEIFDGTTKEPQELTMYINQHYKAIIGVQSYYFSIMMQDGITNLHDLIIGPKLNIILDHPAWLKEQIDHGPKDYFLLLHDRNYIEFAKQHFPKLAGCVHFPPAGLLPLTPTVPMEDKKYDLTFIGSYYDYRERLSNIWSYDKSRRHVATHYLRIMHRNPDLPAEVALHKTAKRYGIPSDAESFLQLFYDMRQVNFCIYIYYREKIIQTLLDAGIEIHVFGDSWKKAPFAKHSCLMCHPSINARDSLEVMQNSKISLNIMSWHKDGLTERIFNSMLCQSVVLSDRTTALGEEFNNYEDLILFSLTDLSVLPHTIKTLLSNKHTLQQIALNGYNKVLAKHTWKERAFHILKLLE